MREQLVEEIKALEADIEERKKRLANLKLQCAVLSTEFAVGDTVNSDGKTWQITSIQPGWDVTKPHFYGSRQLKGGGFGTRVSRIYAFQNDMKLVEKAAP